MNNFTFGNDSHQHYETICGGAGAGEGYAGASAAHTHMTNSRLTDPEILEWRFPVILEAFSIRPGSGGGSAWPGGDGVTRRVRNGGEPGAPGRAWVERVSGEKLMLSATDQVDVGIDDVFVVETPGGGYGEVSPR